MTADLVFVILLFVALGAVVGTGLVTITRMR